MKRNRLHFIAVMTGLVLGLTACGKPSNNQAAAEGQGANDDTVSASDSGDIVEVNFWSLFTGDDGVTMDAIVNQFNEEHSNIKVTHIAMAADTDLYVKLPMVAGDDNQAPDLCVIHNNYIPYLAEKGAIQPIDPLVEGFDNLKKENFNSVEMADYDGKRYGVILDFPSAVVYGNKALIEQYYPEMIEDYIVTWDEIYELGDRLAADGVIGQVKPLAGSFARNDVLQTFVTQGGTYSQDGKTLALDKEILKKAQGEWKNLYDKGYFMEEDSDAMGMFALGETVFVTGGTWNLNVVNAYGLDYIMLPCVQYDTNDVITYAAAHTFAMPQKNYTDEKKEGCRGVYQLV